MLQVERLHCGYGAKIVLAGIDVSVHQGEFLGVIGPNGSGKTTLLRAISRILKPVSGNIFLEGRDIRCLRPNELARHIAVASQSQFPQHLTVEEYVLLGRTPHYQTWQFLETETDSGIARQSMERAGVESLSGRYLDELSSGEKQLATIARALAQEPKLLLLDEPTAHLDITHQVKILDLTRKLNRERGLTVIAVLHDLNLASEYCDKLSLIDHGKIHTSGVPVEVIRRETIEAVYQTKVVIQQNPLSSKPFVILVSHPSPGAYHFKQYL